MRRIQICSMQCRKMNLTSSMSTRSATANIALKWRPNIITPFLRSCSVPRILWPFREFFEKKKYRPLCAAVDIYREMLDSVWQYSVRLWGVQSKIPKAQPTQSTSQNIEISLTRFCFISLCISVFVKYTCLKPFIQLCSFLMYIDNTADVWNVISIYQTTRCHKQMSLNSTPWDFYYIS